MRSAVGASEVTGVADSRGGPRQTKVVIRHVQPWSVFKLSLVFYFCMLLVFLLASVILYWALQAIGVIESLSNVLETVLDTRGGFEINGFWIFSRLFVVGVVGVVAWSLVNLLVALLYNLIADVVGGIQVTLAERR